MGVDMLKLCVLIALSMLVLVACGGDSDIKISPQQTAFESKIFELKESIDRADDTKEAQNKYVSEVSGDPVDNAWIQVENFKKGKHRLLDFVGTVEEINNDGTIKVLHENHKYFLSVPNGNTALYNSIAKLSSGDVIYFDAETFGEKSWTNKGFLKEPEWKANLYDILAVKDGKGSGQGQNSIEVVKNNTSQDEFIAKVKTFRKLIKRAQKDDNELKVQVLKQQRAEVLSKFKAVNWVGELKKIDDVKTGNDPLHNNIVAVVIEVLAASRYIALELEYKGEEIIVPVYSTLIINENFNTKERIFKNLGMLSAGDKVSYTSEFSRVKRKSGLLTPEVITMDKTVDFRKS
jgi:hypothetical protein